MIIEQIPILYYDEHIIIAQKPTMLLSVPGRAEDNKDCLITRIQTHFADALIVHRLDLATSGIILLARGHYAHRKLSMAFEARQVGKKYIALLHGNLENDEGLINAPLITDWPNRPRQKIDFENGKPSQTYYKIIARNGINTRVEFTPITGRSHQLRVHSIHIGHPICGDLFYIGEDNYNRLMLHSSMIEFAHPKDERIVKFESIPEF